MSQYKFARAEGLIRPEVALYACHWWFLCSFKHMAERGQGMNLTQMQRFCQEFMKYAPAKVHMELRYEYRAQYALRDILKAAELDPDNLVLLPWDRHMVINNGNIVVRIGREGDWVPLWLAPDPLPTVPKEFSEFLEKDLAKP